MSTIGKAVKDYWQPLTGMIVLVLAMGKLFWDVEALKAADDRALMQRIEMIEARVGDDALIDWNRWRASLEGRVDRLEAR